MSSVNNPEVVFHIIITYGRSWYEDLIGYEFAVYMAPSFPGLLIVMPGIDYMWPQLHINPADVVAIE